jgi:apyrase
VLRGSHESGGARFAVVFDAGSTGSRVHVFKFEVENGSLQLVSDTFEQLKPGLSAYPDDPEAAAASLKPLLDVAMKTVPGDLQVSVILEAVDVCMFG